MATPKEYKDRFESSITTSERVSKRSESVINLHPYIPLFDIVNRNAGTLKVPEALHR